MARSLQVIMEEGEGGYVHHNHLPVRRSCWSEDSVSQSYVDKHLVGGMSK